MPWSIRAQELVCLLAGLLAACNRTEEPQSSYGAESASVTSPTTPAVTATASAAPPVASAASAPAAVTASAAPACLVPTPAEAPPAQKPAAECPRDPGPVPKLPKGVVSFPDAPKAPRVKVEIAREEAHRNRGLMYRTKMPENQGMLFSWTNEAPRSFWMRNTCIPLDMLFVALDGTILGILEQVPVLSDAARGVHCPAGHVLELNAGWCRRHGIKAGMRLAIQ